MRDAIGYIRVSSEEQVDSGLGLEAQRQRIAAYWNMKGLHLAEVVEDPGVSCGKPVASRPAGRNMLVAPVYEKGATPCDVYLPAGTW
jgi:DNA invertase Pin-like site-specific DNA recombinase